MKRSREEAVHWAKTRYANAKPLTVSCLQKMLETLPPDMVVRVDEDRSLFGAVFHDGGIILLTDEVRNQTIPCRTEPDPT